MIVLWIIPMIKTLAPFAGQFAMGQIQRMQSQADIRRQNEYNSPIQAIGRLQKAGLPYAAYEHGQTGNQSAIPETNKSIGNYAATSLQFQQVKGMQADTRLKNAEADLKEAERDYLLSGKGEDRAGTNQTSMIQMEQQLKAAQNKGMEIANEIQARLSQNQPYKISLENEEQRQRIDNMIQQYTETGERIEGIKLDNALKEIERKWKPSMNRANLNSILLGNDIKVTQKGLMALEYELKQHTQGNEIQLSDINLMTHKLGYEILGANYEQTKGWNEFVNKSRDLFNADGKNMSLPQIGRSLGALIYTTLSGVSGGIQMPMLPSLGSQAKTFNTYNTIRNE